MYNKSKIVYKYFGLGPSFTWEVISHNKPAVRAFSILLIFSTSYL